MSVTLTAFDLRKLLPELKQLENARLDHIFQDESRIVLSFYVRGKGKTYLHLHLPSLLYLSPTKKIQSLPSGFVEVLRKYLKNNTLTSVSQYGFERILLLTFPSGQLVVELFDKGNLVLLRKDNTIIAARHYKKFRERTIRGGIPYLFPSQAEDPEKIPLTKLRDGINSQKQAVVKTLATWLSLGGKYAEEVCKRAQIEKSKKELAPEEAQQVHHALRSLFAEPLLPAIYEATFAPIPLNDQQPRMLFPTFSALLEHQLQQDQPPKKNVNPQLIRIQRIIEKQKEALSTTQKKYEIYNLMGSKLYEHYAAVDTLLTKVRNLKNNKGWTAVQDSLEGEKVAVNTKKGTLTVDLP